MNQAVVYIPDTYVDVRSCWLTLPLLLLSMLLLRLLPLLLLVILSAVFFPPCHSTTITSTRYVRVDCCSCSSLVGSLLLLVLSPAAATIAAVARRIFYCQYETLLVVGVITSGCRPFIGSPIRVTLSLPTHHHGLDNWRWWG